MVTQLPLPKKGRRRPPLFSANIYCDQTAGWIKMALGMEVGLGPGHIVLDGESAPLPKKGTEPQFSAHFYCRQTAGCIKMPLGIEVGLSPGDFVFHGDPAPPEIRAQPPPFFWSRLSWPNIWMDEGATWYGSRPWPRPHCVRRGPSSSAKGAQQLPLFSAHVYCGHGRPFQLLLSSC